MLEARSNQKTDRSFNIVQDDKTHSFQTLAKVRIQDIGNKKLQDIGNTFN